VLERQRKIASVEESGFSINMAGLHAAAGDRLVARLSM